VLLYIAAYLVNPLRTLVSHLSPVWAPEPSLSTPLLVIVFFKTSDGLSVCPKHILSLAQSSIFLQILHI
jgi:hypothetical protein